MLTKNWMKSLGICLTDKNVLFLGSADSPLVAWLEQQGESVLTTCEILDKKFVIESNISFIISYGYRHIIKSDILSLFPRQAINLHISYLPWNKGADPNFWSFVQDTPKGVTIHYLDPGLDTGDIIVQKEITFNEKVETLASSYKKLHDEIQHLFKVNWHFIKNKSCLSFKQPVGGSFHRLKDKEPLQYLLKNGWDTPVSLLKNK